MERCSRPTQDTHFLQRRFCGCRAPKGIGQQGSLVSGGSQARGVCIPVRKGKGGSHSPCHDPSGSEHGGLQCPIHVQTGEARLCAGGRESWTIGLYNSHSRPASLAPLIDSEQEGLLRKAMAMPRAGREVHCG